MALSDSTNYSLNRTQVINKAFEILGIRTESETPSDFQMSGAVTSLNMMLKAWAADGLQLSTRKTQSVTLTSGTGTYTLGPSGDVVMDRPLRLLKVTRKKTSDGLEVPIEQISQDEYYQLNNKSSSGLPVQYYYDPTLTNGTIYTWPVIDQSGYTLELVYVKQYDDMDASTDDFEFPQEWYLAISFGLADLLAEDYATNDSLANRIHFKATRFKDEAMGFDVENASTYIQPDMRYY